MFKWRGDGDETYPSGVKLPRKTSYNALNISISSSSHQESILFILRLPFTCRHLLTKKDVSIIAPVTLQVNVKLLYGGREKIRMTTFYHVYRNTSTRPVQVQLPRTRTRCLQAITRRQKVNTEEDVYVYGMLYLRFHQRQRAGAAKPARL